MTELESMRAQLKETGLYRLDGTTLVDAELQSYAAGLEPLREALLELERECFAATACSFGLAAAEARLGIEDAEDQPVELRRSHVMDLGKMGPQSFSVSCLKLAMAARGVPADIVERPEETKLYLSFGNPMDAWEQKQKAKRQAMALLPAHLRADLDFRSSSWDVLDEKGLAWDACDMAGYTWDQADQSVDGLIPIAEGENTNANQS